MRVIKVIGLYMLTATLAIWVPCQADDQNMPRPIMMVSGLVGLADRQFARLNAVNFACDPIEAVLVFRDHTGELVKKEDVTVEPGQGVFLKLALKYDEYKIIRAEIVQRELFVGSIVASLEIIDEETKTTMTFTELFPSGPGKAACKIASLAEPTACE